MKNRKKMMFGKLKHMREDSKQFEDQMKRITNLEQTGRISSRKKYVTMGNVGVEDNESRNGRTKKREG